MSTLRPGIVSQAITDLRNAAIREMDAVPPGVTENVKPSFDVERKTPPNVNPTPEDDNWVARYPGQNSPHIGNGSGGPR